MVIRMTLRRRRRILRMLGLATACVSLAASVAALIAWPVSHYRTDGLIAAARSPSAWHVLVIDVRSQKGVLIVDVTHPYVTARLVERVREFAPTFNHDVSGPLPQHTYPTRWGFGWLDQPKQFGAGVAVPHWFATLIFATPAAVYGSIRLRARRHPPAGHCVNCGYDLRATPDRCPECGTTADNSEV